MKALLLLLLGTVLTHAQLSVTVNSPKIVGQKAVVPLAIENGLRETVESARAACFLLDEQGKMIGHGTRWIIGGSNTNGLPAGATNTFHFVITSADSAGFSTTNLTAKVTVNRLVLEGGKLADPVKDVQVRNTPE